MGSLESLGRSEEEIEKRGKRGRERRKNETGILFLAAEE